MNNTLGNRLEQIKKNERLSIEEYMNLLGVTKSSYYNWKNGENYPNTEVLIKVLRKYPSYSAEWLLMGVGEMHKAKSLQIVNDGEQEYGVKYLSKRVTQLAEEVEELKAEVNRRIGIIEHLGTLLTNQRFDLSPQKRHKKGDDKE